MRDSLEPRPSRPYRVTGGHVLLSLVAFFGAVFAVNGYFLHAALSTHTGIVANEPYRKGLAYNARIAAAERQAALGWRDEVKLSRDGRVDVRILGRAAAPVAKLMITGALSRPATAEFDRPVSLAEREPGHYVAELGALADGGWILAIEARSQAGDGEPIYRVRRRLWLTP